MSVQTTVQRVTCRAAFLTVAALCTAAPAGAESYVQTPPPRVSQPDPLRSPVAPHREPSRRPPGPTESQQLQNYRTDLRNRLQELDQARPDDSPRLTRERREVQRELERVRRLTR